ncbi:ABC transporter ATP-binding protein [Trueperella sp. LYQ143]|uniref:ABC transporter ATP-binding protein n=1 Tax=unclassified Trueperella TaxID=2630174 RepID=UPI0039838DBD
MQRSISSAAHDEILGVKDVSFSYGKKRVLDNVSLSCGRGIYGILGPNGAGKTTLLRILSTELAADSGELRILGRSVVSYKDALAVRPHIGYLPQRVDGVDTLTVRELVSYVAHLRKISPSQQKSDVMDAIEIVGLTDRADSKVKQLSGGMRQRAGLACALVGRPQLLILDEPTVGLDPAQRWDFKRILREYSDASILLSTHIVEDVAAVAEEVIVIDQGTVRFIGSTTDLASRGGDARYGDTALERGYLALIDSAAGQRDA